MQRFTRRMVTMVVAPAAFLAGALAPRAGAQLTAQLDVGSGVRRESSAERVAYPARFDVAAAHRSALGDVSATGRAFGGFTRSTRSDVTVAARFVSAGWSRLALRGMLEGGSAGTRLAEGVRRDRAEVLGGGVIRLFDTDVSASVGRAWFEAGAVTPRASRAELGIARSFARGAMSLGARRVQYPDAFVALHETTYVVAGFPYHGTVEKLESVGRRYGEAEAMFEWSLLGARLEARGGARFTANGIRPERWARAGIELPIVRQLAIVAEAGQRMSTPEQRLPGYRFGSVSLRVRRDVRASVPSVASVARPMPDEPHVDVTDAGTIVVSATAVRVELMGDFSDWKPVALEPVAPATWRHRAPLAPGMYHVVIRIDGGDWRPPAGLPVYVDDLEQPVGLLLVGP